jgi:hypothetical protein
MKEIRKGKMLVFFNRWIPMKIVFVRTKSHWNLNHTWKVLNWSIITWMLILLIVLRVNKITRWTFNIDHTDFLHPCYTMFPWTLRCLRRISTDDWSTKTSVDSVVLMKFPIFTTMFLMNSMIFTSDIDWSLKTSVNSVALYYWLWWSFLF